MDASSGDVLSYTLPCGVLLILLVSIIYYLTRPARHGTFDMLQMWPIGPTTPSLSVPGPPPTHPDAGNLPDIKKAGNVTDFLHQLHAKYGDIASFWWRREHCVAICSPELFEKSAHLFDRPAKMLEVYEPLLTKHNIFFTNLKEGRQRRHLYDKPYTPGPFNDHYSIFKKNADDVAARMADLPAEEHLDIYQYMLDVSFSCNAMAYFGIVFENYQELYYLRTVYNEIWEEVEAVITLGPPEEGSPRMEKFQKVRELIFAYVKRAIKNRQDNPPPEEEERFIDVILKSGFPEEVVLSDAVFFLMGGTHCELLTFCFYHLAANPDIQERLHDELITVLGSSDVTSYNVKDLIYTRQVIDETLRCLTFISYAARYSTEDFELGGHKIPAMTPIILSLAVSLQDEKRWPDPNRFDPDRFSPENRSKMPNNAFAPFAVGERKCPGRRLKYAESTVVIATLLCKFVFKLTSSEVPEKVFSIAARLKDPIWLTIERRS